jgi:hypothetical protein
MVTIYNKNGRRILVPLLIATALIATGWYFWPSIKNKLNLVSSSSSTSTSTSSGDTSSYSFPNIGKLKTFHNTCDKFRLKSVCFERTDDTTDQANTETIVNDENIEVTGNDKNTEFVI